VRNKGKKLHDCKALFVAFVLFLFFAPMHTMATAPCTSEDMALVAGFKAGADSPQAYAKLIQYLATERNAFEPQVLDRLMTATEAFDPLETPSNALTPLENRTYKGAIQKAISMGKADVAEMKEVLAPYVAKQSNHVVKRGDASKSTVHSGFFPPVKIEEWRDQRVRNVFRTKSGSIYSIMRGWRSGTQVRSWPAGQWKQLSYLPHHGAPDFFETSDGRAFILFKSTDGLTAFELDSDRKFQFNLFTGNLTGLPQTENREGLVKKWKKAKVRLFEKNDGTLGAVAYQNFLSNDETPWGVVIDLESLKATHSTYQYSTDYLIQSSEGGIFKILSFDSENEKLNLFDFIDNKIVTIPMPSMAFLDTVNYTWANSKLRYYRARGGDSYLAAIHGDKVHLVNITTGIVRSWAVNGSSSLHGSNFFESPHGDVYFVGLGFTTSKTIYIASFRENTFWTEKMEKGNNSQLDRMKFVTLADGRSILIATPIGWFDDRRKALIFDIQAKQTSVADFTGTETTEFHETHAGKNGSVKFLLGSKKTLEIYQVYGPLPKAGGP
jgi:hypothetical protein